MSTTKYESADLLLKLYDMRREETMRKARQWFAGFNPQNVQEIINALTDEQTSAYYRMVTTYWEMAAALVHQGAIDEEMFNAVNAEHFFVYSKIEPYVEELRAMFGRPVLPQLEKLILNFPGARERLAHMREMSRGMAERRAAAQAEQSDKGKQPLNK